MDDKARKRAVLKGPRGNPIAYAWFSHNPDARLALPKLIAESTKDWTTWENLQHLHETLKEHNQPVPGELSDWANDVETGKRPPPNFVHRGAPLSDLLTNAWFSHNPDARLALPKWIAASTKHLIAWEGLQHLHETLTKYNLPIPGELTDWPNDVVWGKREKPKRKKGGDGLQNVLRDFFIVIQVKEMLLYGFPATSTRQEPKGAIRSACHFVASIQRTKTMDYKAVYVIWKSSKWAKLKKALALYSGVPAGFRAWVGEQARDKQLLDLAMSDLDLSDWRW